MARLLCTGMLSLLPWRVSQLRGMIRIICCSPTGIFKWCLFGIRGCVAVVAGLHVAQHTFDERHKWCWIHFQPAPTIAVWFDDESVECACCVGIVEVRFGQGEFEVWGLMGVLVHVM